MIAWVRGVDCLGKALSTIRYFGGFEMVAAVGGMLRAAELGMVIIVDGFIMTNCVLAGKALYPALTDYCIYGHQGDECGHKLVLDYLGAEPLLNLGLRLGEGTGAICAYPLLVSAVNMINEKTPPSNSPCTGGGSYVSVLCG